MTVQLASLRGSSAEALHTLHDLVDVADRSAEDFGTLGAQLFSLAALLRGEPALRRAVTDASAEADAKAGLVRALLADKVGGEALEILAKGAGLRWVASRDLADSLEHLGVVATVRAAGQGSATRLSDELFVVTQMVEQSPELRDALSDPQRTTADKSGLLTTLLEGRALASTIALVTQALSGSHRSFVAAIKDYQQAAAAVADESVARVSSAQPLSDQALARLGEALSAHYGRALHLNVEVVPDLIGGIRVAIGDDIIDGTVVSRLDAARRRIAG
jgi:F-type H+-transporting ATPase subunit delta